MRRSTNDAAQDVDGDAAGIEAAVAGLVAGMGQGVGKIRVFDHPQFAVAEHEVPDALQVVRLGDGLAGHLRAGERVQADEERVDRFDQRVVDLEVADVVDAGGGHFVQRARPAKGQQAAAVTVRGKSHPMLLFEQDLSVHREGGHDALLEEPDALRIEAREKSFRGKEVGVCASFCGLVMMYQVRSEP